jgi:hypothetical protein
MPDRKQEKPVAPRRGERRDATPPAKRDAQAQRDKARQEIEQLIRQLKATVTGV